MQPDILGLDVGGANLKAATNDRRVVSVPFALWKQPDRLPFALADLVTRFPDSEELAVTMTGELCDCFETKKDGVDVIIEAVRSVSSGRPIRVWSTRGMFVDPEEAKRSYLDVAGANWHALATFVGRFVPNGRALLIDVGSTTTDLIPILDGVPVSEATTDYGRLRTGELVYTGVRRTPLCALMGWSGMAEFFATTLDVYTTLGLLPEDPTDCNTADGRPATKAFAQARLCRMYGGDRHSIPEDRIQHLAESAYREQIGRMQLCESGIRHRLLMMPPHSAEIPFAVHLPDELPGRSQQGRITYITSGSGEFLAREVAYNQYASPNGISLADQLGPVMSSCAPAFAVAVLATSAS